MEFLFILKIEDIIDVPAIKTGNHLLPENLQAVTPRQGQRARFHGNPLRSVAV